MPGSDPPAPTIPPPAWLRPKGVAAGTWQYVHQRSIADRYDAFVADTPLCKVDSDILGKLFPSGESSGRVAETILDLGSGSGRSAIPLAQRGYRVLAVDLSQRMLEVMLDKIEQPSPGVVVPLRGNLVELGFLKNDCVDHAICLFSTLGMIQGRAHRRSVLQHAARIVRDQGSLLLHVHNRWSAIREPAGIRSLCRSWWGSVCNREAEFGDARYAYRGLDAMFMHRFSRRELLQDLREAGWTIDRWWNVAIDGSSVSEGTQRAIPGGFIVRTVKESVFV